MDLRRPHGSVAVEQHGIDAVPRVKRTKTWADLFVIYAGLNISIGALIFGGILVPAFSWPEAVLVTVIGNTLAGLLMLSMGHMGVDHGIPAAVMSRLFLGHPTGATLCSMVMLVSLTGWFAVNAELGGMAVDQVVSSVFGYSNPTLMIIILSLTNIVVAILGIESIKWLSRVSVPLLLAVLIWVGATILTKHSILELIDYEPKGGVSLMTGIDWMIGGWIVGIYVAADISRYVKSRRHNLVGTMLGIVPAAILLTFLGALSSLATGDWNPINGIQALGLGAPALVVIVFSTWTTNDVNLYSAGLSLSNMLPKVARWQNTLILGLAGTLLAMARITEHFTAFLESLAHVFGPLVGVALADYFIIRRGRFDPTLIYGPSAGGPYPAGFNPVAFAVIVIGTLTAFVLPDALPASIVSIGLSAIGYLVLMRVMRPLVFATGVDRIAAKTRTDLPVERR